MRSGSSAAKEYGEREETQARWAAVKSSAASGWKATSEYTGQAATAVSKNANNLYEKNYHGHLYEKTSTAMSAAAEKASDFASNAAKKK